MLKYIYIDTIGYDAHTCLMLISCTTRYGAVTDYRFQRAHRRSPRRARHHTRFLRVSRRISAGERAAPTQEKPYDHMNTPAPLYGLCCLLSVSPSVHSGRSPCQPTLCSPRRSAHHDTLLLPPSPLSAMMSARDWRLRPSWHRRRCRSTSIRLQIRKLFASKLGSYSPPN